ncbi:unnamed protein product [marine sediment metagenome]|uniref:Carboxypeptidase regulatory-like domain-containing protein n=1 Tax=marine sediment metagenome TaxID=412755 RepID=X1A0L1_9ZZZZ
MPRISGIVVEKWTRRPVVGVKIQIGHYIALTDAMGRFSMESPLGTVQISMTHRDFHPYVMSLNVVRAADIGVIGLSSRVVAL